MITYHTDPPTDEELEQRLNLLRSTFRLLVKNHRLSHEEAYVALIGAVQRYTDQLVSAAGVISDWPSSDAVYKAYADISTVALHLAVSALTVWVTAPGGDLFDHDVTFEASPDLSPRRTLN